MFLFSREADKPWLPPFTYLLQKEKKKLGKRRRMLLTFIYDRTNSYQEGRSDRREEQMEKLNEDLETAQNVIRALIDGTLCALL